MFLPVVNDHSVETNSAPLLNSSDNSNIDSTQSSVTVKDNSTQISYSNTDDVSICSRLDLKTAYNQLHRFDIDYSLFTAEHFVLPFGLSPSSAPFFSKTSPLPQSKLPPGSVSNWLHPPVQFAFRFRHPSDSDISPWLPKILKKGEEGSDKFEIQQCILDEILREIKINSDFEIIRLCTPKQFVYVLIRSFKSATPTLEY